MNDMNSINGIPLRNAAACIMNYRLAPVIPFDLGVCNNRLVGDTTVRLEYGNRFIHTTLKYSVEDEKYMFLYSGAFLSADFGYDDFMELVNHSQSPSVKAGQVVVLATYFSNYKGICGMHFMKVSDRIEPHCIESAYLTDATDEDIAPIISNIRQLLR